MPRRNKALQASRDRIVQFSRTGMAPPPPLPPIANLLRPLSRRLKVVRPPADEAPLPSDVEAPDRVLREIPT